MIPKAPSQDQAVRIAKDLGVTVSKPRGTGEILFQHPLGRVRMNARRKTASRALVSLLRRVSDAANELDE